MWSKKAEHDLESLRALAFMEGTLSLWENTQRLDPLNFAITNTPITTLQIIEG